MKIVYLHGTVHPQTLEGSASDLLSVWKKLPGVVQREISDIMVVNDAGNVTRVNNPQAVLTYLEGTARSKPVVDYYALEVKTKTESYALEAPLDVIVQHFCDNFGTAQAAHNTKAITLSADCKMIAYGVDGISAWILNSKTLPTVDTANLEEPVLDSTVTIDVHKVFSEVDTLIAGVPNESRLRKLMSVLQYSFTK